MVQKCCSRRRQKIFFNGMVGVHKQVSVVSADENLNFHLWFYFTCCKCGTRDGLGRWTLVGEFRDRVLARSLCRVLSKDTILT